MLETWMILNRRVEARLLSAVRLFAIAFTLWVSLSTVACAASYSGDRATNPPFANQSVERPAALVSSKPNARIAIYLRPDEEENRVGYGIDGDSVTVIEQTSDNQNKVWNHIRFDNPPYAEGWVPETSVALKSAEAQKQRRQQAIGDRYLGNRQSAQQPFTQQDIRRGNTQQNSDRACP